MPKSDDKVAISIYNKHTQEPLKDLQSPEEHVVITRETHAMLTSWPTIPPPTSKIRTGVETKWLQKENYSMAPLDVQ